MPALPPSGRQVRLSAHGQSAVVVEVGDGLRDYRVGGRPVLDGFAEDEMGTAARGLPLVPWPDRLHEGRYASDGVTCALPLDEPEQANAVHGLGRGVDGRARVVLRNPADNREVEVWADEAYGWLEVFTGDTLPEPERRRRGLAVEPMTAPPNALQTGEAVVRLAPGETHTGRWGIVARGW